MNLSVSAGYAQAPITPALDQPVFLAGFDRNRRATAIHDDLYARALALDWNQTPLVLVALDLIGLERFICQKIASHLPGINLVICATHTHHGPDTIGLWGPDLSTSGVDPEYIQRLEETIVRVSTLALQNRRPALLKSASVQVPGIAKNARNPDILDQELSIVQFSDPETGFTQANLVVFPCHPETLFDENTIITSDYPYFLRQTIEETTGAPCLFFAGALGGMMTPDVLEHSFSEAAQNGARLADAGLRALSDCLVDPRDRFSFHTLEYSIPLSSPLLEAAIQSNLVHGPQTKDGAILTEASLLRLGATWFAFCPGEVLPALGLRIKSILTQAGAWVPVVIGLANDELGYILPDEVYQYPENPFEPGAHYEETMSIGPNAGSLLVQAVIKLLGPTQTESV